MEEFMAEEKRNEEASHRMKDFINQRRQEQDSRKEEVEKKEWKSLWLKKEPMNKLLSV